MDEALQLLKKCPFHRDTMLTNKKLSYDELLNNIENYTGKTDYVTRWDRRRHNPFIIKNYVVDITKRRYFVAFYSWSIPNRGSLEKMMNFIGNDKVLEVGCGNGLWAHLLKLSGVDIVATDIDNDPSNVYAGIKIDIDDINYSTYIKVEKYSAKEAVKIYNDRNVLFSCWGSGAEHDGIPDFTGNKIIWIGEKSGGCTEDYIGSTEDSGWEIMDEIDIPVWYGIHDEMIFYEKKTYEGKNIYPHLYRDNVFGVT